LLPRKLRDGLPRRLGDGHHAVHASSTKTMAIA